MTSSDLQLAAAPGGDPNDDRPLDAPSGGPPRGELVRGSIWSVASVGIASASGLAFWVVAARLRSQGDVDLATKLWTAIQFVNYLTSMGLPVAVARYVRDDSLVARRLFEVAALYTLATSAIGTAAYFVFFRGDVTARLYYWGRPAGWALFLVAVAGMSMALLVEIRLMSLRHWRWVMLRVLFLGLVRFPLLFVVPIDDDGLWLLLLVSMAPAITGVVGYAVLAGRDHARALTHIPAEARPFLRYATVNYLGLLLEKAPLFALPVVVSMEVEHGYSTFYFVFMITVILFLLPETIGRVLIVEAGKDGAKLEHQVVTGLGLMLPVMATAALVAFAKPDVVELVFGSRYAEASDIFPSFVAAGVFWAVTATGLARARHEGETMTTLAISGVYAAVVLGAAVLLVDDRGVSGAATAWVWGHMAAAVVAGATLLIAHRARR